MPAKDAYLIDAMRRRARRAGGESSYDTNIVRGSDPAGTVRYLFGKKDGAMNTPTSISCARAATCFPRFDMDGKPAASYAEIGRRFDRRYRVRERKDDPFPPDMRGKDNPEREHGRKRVWHCSLAIKAGRAY